MNARTSSTPRVLSTCAGSIQPRRAVPTPNRICRAQRIRAVTVAVDHQRDASGRGTARQRAVQIEMPGRAVHFHRGAGFSRRREQRVEIEAVPTRPCRASGWQDA